MFCNWQGTPTSRSKCFAMLQSNFTTQNKLTALCEDVKEIAVSKMPIGEEPRKNAKRVSGWSCGVVNDLDGIDKVLFFRLQKLKFTRHVYDVKFVRFF